MTIDKNGISNQQPLKIAHALGSIDQTSYTNSEAAFHHSVLSGFIFLEADLALTKDEKAILYHHSKPATESELPWRGKKAYEVDWAELSDKKYLDKYPILTLEKFVSLVNAHPDVFVILDIKSRNKKKVLFQKNPDEINIINHLFLKHYRKTKKDKGAIGKALFSLFSWADSGKVYPHRTIIENLTNSCDQTTLARLIPQVDRFSCPVVSELYDFPLKIWKPSGESMSQAFSLAADHACPYISLYYEQVDKSTIAAGKAFGVKVLSYGTDQPEIIERLTRLGADGFFLESFNLS
jgi:glycerophosphoryl diester phosphodiesterase